MRLLFVFCFLSIGGSSISQNIDSLYKSAERIMGKKVLLTRVQQDLLKAENAITVDSVFILFSDSSILSFSGACHLGDFYTEGDSILFTNDNKSYGRLLKNSWLYLNYLMDVESIVPVSNSKVYQKRQSKTLFNQDSRHYTYTTPNKQLTIKYFLDNQSELSLITTSWKPKDYYIDQITEISFNQVHSSYSRKHFPKLNTPYWISIKDKMEKVSSKYYPFSTISQLDDLENIQGSLKPNYRTVIVSSYIGCAPCQLLKNDLQELVEKGKINPNQVAVLNTIDIKANIQKYIADKSLKFPYYQGNKFVEGFSAPTIGFYKADGRLDYTLVSYTKLMARNISKYLRNG